MKWKLYCCALALACGCSRETTSHAKETAKAPPAATTPANPPTTTLSTPIPGEAPAVAEPQDAIDRALAQQVRQALQADASLSTEAKSVTVKAEGGTVTLDGLVQSEEEKSSVEALVKAIPGVERVENQLLVKTS